MASAIETPKAKWLGGRECLLIDFEKLCNDKGLRRKLPIQKIQNGFTA
jgi:hypothetical protein